MIQTYTSGTAITFLINYFLGSLYFGTILCFAILSFAFGVLFLCSLKSISNYFDKRRAIAIQIGSCGTSVGQFILAPALATIFTDFTVKGGYLILAGLYLNFIVSACLFKPTSSGKTNTNKPAFDITLFKLASFNMFLIVQCLLLAGYVKQNNKYLVKIANGK